MKRSRKVGLLLALAGLIVLIIIVTAVVYAGFYQLVGQTIMSWSNHYQPSSVEEAQEIAPYEICVPSHLPAEVSPTPVIGYLDVWPDGRAELIFGYYHRGTAEQCVEVRQWYWSSEQPPDLNITSLKKSLVVWLVGWDRAEKILDGVTTRITQYESNDTEKWLIEVIGPVSLKGNVVRWTNGKVTYQIYSALDSEETVRIADSICSHNQIGD